MKKYILVLAILFTACETIPYFQKNFEIGRTKTVRMGEPMFYFEVGNADKIYHKKKSGFAYELLYSGISNNIINITYREYSRDNISEINPTNLFIRDAFSEHLTYDISKSDLIAFRNTKFKIIRANSSEIEFVVLESGLLNDSKNMIELK